MRLLTPALLAATLCATLAAQTPRLVKDINPNGASTPVAFTSTSDGLTWFAATSGSGARELWRTDGSTAGTVQVTQGPTTGVQPLQIVALDDVCFFTAGRVPGLHWVSAAGQVTTEGITVLRDTLTAGPTHVFFAGVTTNEGYELHYRDRFGVGGSLDLAPGTDSSTPRNLVYHHGLHVLFFTAFTAALGNELYSFDPHTQQVRVIEVAVGASSTDAGLTLAVGDRLFFTARGGRDLCVTDGSAATVVRTFEVGGQPPRWRERIAMGADLFFVIEEAGAPDWLLWKSDGTSAGTGILEPTALRARDVTATPGGRLYFAAQTASGAEPWVSDGTTANTRQLRDIFPGPFSSMPTPVWFRPVGANRVAFTATDNVHGTELWETDGTQAGTRLLADLDPPGIGSAPTFLHVRRDARVLFQATAPGVDRELMILDDDRAAAIPGRPGGVGLLPSGEPVLGTTVDLSMHQPGAVVFAVVLGPDRATIYRLPGGGAPLLVDPLVVILAPADAQGAGRFGLPIPSTPNLAGLRIATQTLSVDGMGELDTSAEWLLKLGRN